MSLRKKINIIIIGLIVLYGVVDFGIHQFIIYPSFLAIEQEGAVKDAKRVEGAIAREILYLDSLVHDWAAWDDTYDFVDSRSEEYIKANLPISTFIDNNVNLIFICDPTGKVVWGEIYDLETEETIQIDNFPKEHLLKSHPLISYKTENTPLSQLTIAGIYITSKGPMLISSRPILTTGNEGAIRGSFIMGRLLTDELIENLVNQTQVDFQIYQLQDDSLALPLKTLVEEFNDTSKYNIKIIDNNLLQICTLYPDIEGNNALLLKSRIQRKIIKTGLQTIHYSMGYVLLAGLGSLVFVLWFLQKLVINPVKKITDHTIAVRRTNDLSKRINIQSHDEIGVLANEFDELLYQLEKRTNALKESEEKLVRSKKMESLGLLAGGVAHDLNNVLSGIVTYPELILMDLPEDSKIRKPMENIQESGLKATAIVQDLLTIARGIAITKEPVDLNRLVIDFLSSPECMKLKHYHPSVTISTHLAPDLLNVNGSHIHIRKALMNLASNASEADGSSKVTISTSNRYLDKPLQRYEDITKGEYVVLSVSDNGRGIFPEDLKSIFEPFYSKKVMGKSGTGLGLAVVWNVVRDHDGYVDVKTNDSGATFELYFPITREKTVVKSDSLSIDTYRGNGETILVVDDLDFQQELLCNMLEVLGYNTKVVSSGENAVKYLEKESVDLVLLDMIMGAGLNGRETYQKIVSIRPDQKAIIISGFSETEDVHGAQQLGAGQFVKKPVTLERLGMAIKSELEK